MKKRSFPHKQMNFKNRPAVAFWSKHKKKILIVTGIIAIILTALGVKKLWNSTAFERWLKSASLNDLNLTRADIHAEYMKHTVNDENRKLLWNILSQLDKKISEIEWEGKIPSGPAYSREDGYNLYRSN